jgi:elongation factor 1-beta
MQISILVHLVNLQVLIKEVIKIAKAVITFKLMPDSVETDLDPIKKKALEIAREANSIGEMQSKEDPIAFGLKAVLILAMYEVEGADFDGIAGKMQELEGVQTAEVAKMDLALG